MELIVSIVGLFLLFWALSVLIELLGKIVAFFKPSRPPSQPNPRSRVSQQTHSRHSYPPGHQGTGKTERNSTVYRPNSSRSNSASKIVFTTPDMSSGTGSIVPDDELEGLHDAFSGEPVDENRILFQCMKCSVFYHEESFLVVKEMNESKCVCCNTVNIARFIRSNSTGGTDFTPDVVTLRNYKNYIGSVVTFEGLVHEVKESKRGSDYAVMFENKSWTKGFKLVFFSGSIKHVGGVDYIRSLKSKKVKVRGLVVNHEIFGYEIIVYRKSMILGVS